MKDLLGSRRSSRGNEGNSEWLNVFQKAKGEGSTKGAENSWKDLLEKRQKSSKGDEGKNEWLKMFQGAEGDRTAKSEENQKFSKDDLIENLLGKYQNENNDEGSGRRSEKGQKQKFSLDDLIKNLSEKYQNVNNDEGSNSFSKDSLKEKYSRNFGKKEEKKFSKDQLMEFFPSFEQLG